MARSHYKVRFCSIYQRTSFSLFFFISDDNGSKDDTSELSKEFKGVPEGIVEDVTSAALEEGGCKGEIVTAADHSQVILLTKK